MFLEIDPVLMPAEVQRLRELAAAARFVDGRISNPHNTAKNNLQVDRQDAAYQESGRILSAALARNEEFRNYAFPKIVPPPMLCRYERGMNYGVHTDQAFLPVGPRALRSDVSCTIFISDPETYEGGELAIHLGGRRVDIKGRAGSAVVYPSNMLHEVRPVTSGERLVAITFVESQIADPNQRALLYELGEVAALEGLRMQPENRVRIEHVRNGLHRMWGQSG